MIDASGSNMTGRIHAKGRVRKETVLGVVEVEAGGDGAVAVRENQERTMGFLVVIPHCRAGAGVGRGCVLLELVIGLE